MLDAVNSFDYIILSAIEETRCAFLDAFFKFYTSLGNAGIVCIILSLAFLFFKRTRKAGFSCSVSLIFDLVICNCILKPIVARPRPYNFYDGFDVGKLIIAAPTDFAFPSGHTAACFAFSTALFMHNKKWGTVAYLLSALMGYSRLYLAVHYPTDVLGGAAVGIVCGILAVVVVDKIYAHYSEKRSKKDLEKS